MKGLVIFCVILVTATAVPFIDRNTAKIDFVQRRPKRENQPPAAVSIGNTKYGLKDGVPYVQHQVNLANSNDHKLDANAYASKDFHNNGPLNVGGDLKYSHQPSGAGLSISGQSLPGGGTKVGAAGVWNLYKNGGFGVDLKGGYSQNFGGPGAGAPIYGVEIQGGYAFPRRG
ncbi:attacin-A-like [Anoplophora glabripennis]|uniref:attacin-A-like n=1 Tax=Anoplophora glabripennis TaxID=217634 RepID=UPI0008747A57|nr:attacin-A-like [Anoplophora glabripennis]